MVQDWHKDSQSRLTVRKALETVLDEKLPQSYDRKLFTEKCENVYALVVDFANRGRKWAA